MVKDISNSKNIGEIGERIAIGELAKFNIDVLLPMGDNLPFDFVIFLNNRFYKCQVKTSLQTSKDSEGSVFFSLVSSNWYSKTTRVYNKEDVDIFILCDGKNVFIFNHSELEGKKSITIRKEPSINKQTKGTTFSHQVVISEERLNYVLK